MVHFLNYLTGCFPTLATIPVWIGLYQALSNVANEVFKKNFIEFVQVLLKEKQIYAKR